MFLVIRFKEEFKNFQSNFLIKFLNKDFQVKNFQIFKIKTLNQVITIQWKN